MTEVISPKKLIEVAMPLDAINDAAAAEKQPGIGAHPRGLHLWFARRPLAAARAVIYGQLVHDPEDLWRCQNPGRTPSPQVRAAWTRARSKHFNIIEDLVQWGNSSDEDVLSRARAAIKEAWRQTCELNANHPRAEELFSVDSLPPLHDPFAGGGAIPLEAHRLGLDAVAGDLNPVAVLINKAMLEVPSRFLRMPPVGAPSPNSPGLLPEEWRGVEGLAEDVRLYGQWAWGEARERIGACYPDVLVTPELAEGRPDLRPLIGKSLRVLTWIWARTVQSPNPAFRGVAVPLASTFQLSTKAGREAFLEPRVEGGGYRFVVRLGRSADARVKRGTKLSRGANFECLMSGSAISSEHIKTEGLAGRMGTRLMAIVCEGPRGKLYVSATPEHEAAARLRTPEWIPEGLLPDDPRNFWTPAYGLKTYGDLFTSRQLIALDTFSTLVVEAMGRAEKDALGRGLRDDGVALRDGGSGALAYSEAVGLYLAFAVSRLADYNSSLATWKPSGEQVMQTFKRPTVPMTWDFPESNVLGEQAICWLNAVKYAADNLEQCGAFEGPGHPQAVQETAQRPAARRAVFVSTDPPYYDNIAYADLSDFFYLWLRRSLRSVFPDLFSTMVVPKAEELVAAPYRQGGKEAAQEYFLEGMTLAMRNLATEAHPAAPITIYYAFKQSDTEEEGTDSAGWSTFLGAVLRSGLAITGTWPMRTELRNRMIGSGTNALASSIVLVCRPRSEAAGTITRREFVRELNEALPLALDAMTRVDEGGHSPVDPVDLSQAVIGPGMAIFSRNEAVLEADGSPMSVKTALQLINRYLAEADFDGDTQFCLNWFDQYGWDTGPFGVADTLARAKGTTVDGIKASGVLESGGGWVRLLKSSEYSLEWDPAVDARLPVWEALHRLVRAYAREGDSGAAGVLAGIGGRAEAARQLAYRLYTLCDRKGWSADARSYNQVVTGWGAIEEEAARIPGPRQDALFGIEEGSS